MSPFQTLIDGFRTDAVQHAELAGQAVDLVHRRVENNADNRKTALPVRQSHPSDNILSVFMQNTVHRFDRIGIFHHNSNQGYAVVHKISSCVRLLPQKISPQSEKLRQKSLGSARIVLTIA